MVTVIEKAGRPEVNPWVAVAAALLPLLLVAGVLLVVLG
jgi:hypothetical protein